MSQDLLEKILTNKLNEKIDLNELVNFLLTFKPGQYIYPSVIKRKFSISDMLVYDILNILEEENCLKMYYEVFCGFCSKSLGLYEYYSQLKDYTFCEDCEENNITLNNVKVVYKVVAEWKKK